MGERLPCTEEVRGSSPLISTGGMRLTRGGNSSILVPYVEATKERMKQERKVEENTS